MRETLSCHPDFMNWVGMRYFAFDAAYLPARSADHALGKEDYW